MREKRLLLEIPEQIALRDGADIEPVALSIGSAAYLQDPFSPASAARLKSSIR
jgi:hypothetical protein